ncbi:serine/threonine protein kinase [Candidatus Uabimicrobium amorphum]|uniref:Serine/threonine-protein kinase PknB n=1 Tax=Uabimicrobium amorphum TaxID=2596890 RepID=A0A5S9IMG8_UABAM|nr:serine/threonine-protein kinase [Candidatus Uabimicrobium amorphum]BBM84052.1 serine/threonine-protein kinase PknB [Candidatus Uabimicrobium amorphum]
MAIHNFQCNKCGAVMRMAVRPNNALIHVTCMRCQVVIFNNQPSTKTPANPAPPGMMPGALSGAQLGQSFGDIKVPPPIPPGQPHAQPQVPAQPVQPQAKRIRIKDQYTIKKQLGEGTMGRVFLAHDDKNNEDVAVKILVNTNEKLRKYFQREALVLNDLQHPNIIGFKDCGNHNGRLFIVMEYIEGQTLLDRLKMGPILPRHAAHLMTYVLSALHYAYQHNIVHRDIKPANIFITKNREIKVIDLGLGKVITESVDLTKTGQIMGTCFYMPLEQIQRSKAADHPADIYAVGATLYHILVGIAPFEECGRTLDKLFYAKLKNNYIRLKERNKDLPDEIIKIVEKAMEHKPEDRYKTAEEMRTELQNFLQNHPK